MVLFSLAMTHGLGRKAAFASLVIATVSCGPGKLGSSSVQSDAAASIGSSELFSAINSVLAQDPNSFHSVEAMKLPNFFSTLQQGASNSAVAIDGVTIGGGLDHLKQAAAEPSLGTITVADVFERAGFSPATVSEEDFTAGLKLLPDLLAHRGIFSELFSAKSLSLDDDSQASETDDPAKAPVADDVAKAPPVETVAASSDWSDASCKAVGRTVGSGFFISSIMGLGTGILFHVNHELKTVALVGSALVGAGASTVNAIPSWFHKCGR